MVAAVNERRSPLALVVTGEAESWRPALQRIVGPRWLKTYAVRGGGELLNVVSSGLADAAVLDEGAELGSDVLQMLRMIRRVDQRLPVVLISSRADRRWMEHALRLAAFSVVSRPLQLEALLRQLQRIMQRMDAMLREPPDDLVPPPAASRD